MDHLHLLCIFILSITTLFTDINPTSGIPHSWFDAQNHCLGQGLTIEKNTSDQPYWTGVYRRLTPWINILGCFSDSIESTRYIVQKTMTISSVGMCQELCSKQTGYKFAVKKNNCLCIESNIQVNPIIRLSSSDCNYACQDSSDDIYSEDCGGEHAYTMYEIQRVHFNVMGSCLSLQCSSADIRFIPTKCSKKYNKVCENITSPDNGFASNWSLSMEQCRTSQPSTYLFGDFDLNDPSLVCERLPRQLLIVWVGAARQKYTSIDQGWKINEEQRETFLECQMCERNACHFRDCLNLSASYIFCKNISDRFQGKTTSTLMSNHSTTDVSLASRSTTLKSGTSEDLVLKIALPLTVGFITLLLCVVGVVLYKRRRKMTKTDRTTKTEVESEYKKQVYSELDFAQSNSSFALEHCYQIISNGSYPLNERPYNNQESVNDSLRNKQAGKTEEDTNYQNSSIDKTGDTSGYDTITYNKHLEEEATYDHLRQDANET